MPRNVDSEVLDPVIAAELADLEAALAGTAAADPVLVALVADVRADAPPPRAGFREELDQRVAHGFQPEGGPRAWLSGLAAKAAPHRRMLLPAMGAATTLIVALVVVVSAVRDSNTTDGGTPQFLSQSASPPTASVDSDTAVGAAGSALSAHDNLEEADPLQRSGKSVVPDAAAATAAPAAPLSYARQKAASKPGFGRKVEHRTELSLTTSTKKLRDTADGVVRVTQGVGGIVENSNVDATDGGGSATFTLSIPSTRLDDAVKQLSKLAHVSSMSQGTTDITRSFVSAAAKLSDARAERKALLKALGVAKTPERIATLRARLRDNLSEIANYNGQLKSLRRRTDNTTVIVSLSTDGSPPSSSDDGWSFGGAADDALRVLEVVASVVLISAAILLPLGLLFALAALAARAATRRRREQALDGA